MRNPFLTRWATARSAAAIPDIPSELGRPAPVRTRPFSPSRRNGSYRHASVRRKTSARHHPTRGGAAHSHGAPSRTTAGELADTPTHILSPARGRLRATCPGEGSRKPREGYLFTSKPCSLPYATSLSCQALNPWASVVPLSLKALPTVSPKMELAYTW